MNKNVRKKQYIETVVSNALAKRPKSNAVLASEMGISERQFYNLQKKHADAIHEFTSKLVANVRLNAFGALTRKLVQAHTDDSTIALALNLSGDIQKGGEIGGLLGDNENNEGAGVVINVGMMNDKEELQELIEKRLQETRRKNSAKSKKQG